jgi:hypothetical protein
MPAENVVWKYAHKLSDYVDEFVLLKGLIGAGNKENFQDKDEGLRLRILSP